MPTLIQKAGNTIRACGLLLIVLGLVAIFMPRFAGTAIGVVLGFFLVLSGFVRAAFGWVAATWGSALLRFGFGILAIAAGGLMVAQPETALRVVVIVAIVYFVLDGVSAILFAFRLPPGAGGTSVSLAGIVSLAIGIMMWRGWPLPGEQMLGILIGAKLIVDGVVIFIIGQSARTIDEALAADPDAL